MSTRHKSFKAQNILGGVVIMAVILLMYFWLMPDKNWEGVKVTSGQIDSLILPDGSTAYLIGPSQIGYPKTFEENTRRVKMEGEIIFNVVKNNKSFLIQSEKGGAETSGGKFSVNTLEKKNITVQCFENSVHMIAGGKKEIFEIDLNSNEMCSFTKGDGEITKLVIDSSLVSNPKDFSSSSD